MADDPTLVAVRLFVLLLAAATGVVYVARLLHLPYSVALVAFGLGVAAVSPHIVLVVGPQLLLSVLLPGLVFEAAYQTDLRELRRTFGGVVLLAVPGVLISAAIVALVLHLATGLALGLAFLVGAMVSATDPAAVIAAFKRLGVPGRLHTLVESESLFNDGTGIVIFAIGLQAVQGEVSFLAGLVAFVLTVAASVGIGIVAGLVASWLMARQDDHLVELAISVVLAYGTYLLADAVHASGIIATVVAGMTLGSYGRRMARRPRTRDALDTVWEFVAFLLTAFVFLLIGLAISVTRLAQAGPWIVWGLIAVTLGRGLVVYVLLGGTARLWAGRSGQPSLPLTWLHVMFWAGLRGAVSAALALSLPADLPERSLLQGITFGIVICTLLIQGLTIDPLVRRLGLIDRVGMPPPGIRPAASGA